jgi:parvulin-like peptidyl-prolyl isomerase
VRPSHCSSLALVFFFAWCLFFAYQSAQAELIDRVVAYVDRTVITLSELNQAVAFNRALGGDRTKIREETLEGLINRQLLVQEARRLRFVEITDQDVNAELGKLRQRFGSDKGFDSFLADVDVSREQLTRMLAERLLVERFVEKKIGLFIRVSREEAQEYFNAHPDRFRGMRFTDVQKAITAGLQEKKLEEQMEKYLAELKSKADIRVQL